MRRPLSIRAIPRTGERVPAVGLGTAYGFDRDDEQTRRAAALVVRIESGGRLIDTASTYDDAERVLGSIISNEGFRDKLFIATKLEAPDAAELKRSTVTAQDREARPASAPQRTPIGGNHWHSSRRGRRKASADTSV
jgi:aryl-alcohol dehydrogenase-like predicted oxidoreductase